jgi:hypothetical protein
MRVVRHLVRLLAAAAAALLITAVFDPAAGLASTQPGFSTQPRITEHPQGRLPQTGRLTRRPPRQLRPGRVPTRRPHPLLPFGPVRARGPPGRLRRPLRLRGTAFLEVVVRAPTHDQDYRPVLTPTRLRPDFPVLREVNAPGGR